MRPLRKAFSRTSLIRNPRGVGAVVGVIGSGGVFPTNWSGAGTGITYEIIGTGTEDGLPYIDVSMTTAGAFSGGVIRLEAIGGIALAPSQTYTASLYARLMSGSLAGWATLGLRRRTETVTALNGTVVSLLGVTGAALSGQRFSVTEAVAADAATGDLRLTFAGTATGTVILRLGVPQLVVGTAPGNPNFPPPGVIWP